MDWRHIILPTKPGKINFTSFCVEHGRWTRRGGEPLAIFASATETIAAKELKLAVRVDGDQTEVWNKAAKAQDRLSGVAGAEVRSAASPSSFAMTMVAAVVKSIDGYLRQLAGVIDGRSDVIGYAFAINGKVNSAAVFRRVIHTPQSKGIPTAAQASAAGRSNRPRSMPKEPVGCSAPAFCPFA